MAHRSSFTVWRAGAVVFEVPKALERSLQRSKLGANSLFEDGSSDGNTVQRIKRTSTTVGDRRVGLATILIRDVGRRGYSMK